MGMGRNGSMYLPVPMLKRCMPRSDDNERSSQDTRFKTLNRKLTRDPNLHEEYPKKVTVVLPSYEFLPLHYQRRFLLSLGISLEKIRLRRFMRAIKTTENNYNNNEAINVQRVQVRGCKSI